MNKGLIFIVVAVIGAVVGSLLDSAIGTQLGGSETAFLAGIVHKLYYMAWGSLLFVTFRC
ncbi:MAG: hypothetical protein WC814_02775 [Candidatus Paceibacterota bacterium]|jgi:hypothetical protein